MGSNFNVENWPQTCSPLKIDTFWSHFSTGESISTIRVGSFFNKFSVGKLPGGSFFNGSLFTTLHWRRGLTFKIFDFSETAERNLPKLDRKQEVTVIYHVYFFRGGGQDGRPGLWLVDTFLTSSLKHLNRFCRNMTGSKNLYQVFGFESKINGLADTSRNVAHCTP